MPERLVNSDVEITGDLHLVALTEEEYDAVMLFTNNSCEPKFGFGAARPPTRRSGAAS